MPPRFGLLEARAMVGIAVVIHLMRALAASRLGGSSDVWKLRHIAADDPAHEHERSRQSHLARREMILEHFMRPS